MRGELVHDLLDAAPPRAWALAERDRALRYADVVASSVTVAAWLRQHGVRAGDRVLISLTRSRALDTAALLFGCSRVGAVFCVLHEQVVGAALDHVLDDAAPVLVISDSAVVRAAASMRAVPAFGPELDPGPAPRGGHERVSPDAMACMIYTSGSTSRPKAVVSTHAQITFATRAIQAMLHYRPDDVVYTTQPFSFDVGLYQLFLAALCGARVWLPTAAGAGLLIIPELAESGATVLPAVPALAQALLWGLQKSRASEPVPSLRLLTSTGAAMPDGVPAALRERLPGLRIQLMYGLTECKRATIMPVDGDLDRPGSSGLPLPGTRIRIVDEQGEQLPPGAVGEIVITGPHVMGGYWHHPALTAEKFRPTGLHSGDYGHLDADGFLYVEGRRDDVYKQNGFRVSATEVESAALAVPGVRMAAVLPPKNGRDSVLVVVGSVDAEAVRRGLADQLELFKLPKRCLVVGEMPLNQNGKINKIALASAFVA